MRNNPWVIVMCRLAQSILCFMTHNIVMMVGSIYMALRKCK